MRVASGFFEELDAQLPDERGENGEPSATDFLLDDLPRAIDTFAERFDDLPLVDPDDGRLRMAICSGRLVRAFVVYGLLLEDGSIEIDGVLIDR